MFWLHKFYIYFRYYLSRFKDAYRQGTIDIMLGKSKFKIFDRLLVDYLGAQFQTRTGT